MQILRHQCFFAAKPFAEHFLAQNAWQQPCSLGRGAKPLASVKEDGGDGAIANFTLRIRKYHFVKLGGHVLACGVVNRAMG